MQRFDNESGLGRLIRKARHPSQPGFAEARAQLDDITERQHDRLPDRRAAREKALCVDPQDGGWGRPVEAFTAQQTRERIEHAIMDYLVTRQRLLQGLDPEPANALDAWPDRPELPVPKLA